MSMKPVPPPSAAAAPRPSGAQKSHKQRVDKVKRIGGGALKNNRGQKKKKPADDITKALTSLMRTTKSYMKMKMGAHKSQLQDINKVNEPNPDKDTSDLQAWV
ncbi:hypothetical protein PF005_g6179 [Phytophthora fragariae]|uniref:Uncharacterized protein n=2 Tax=Phytophthora TaxID=4783 RepID=A0A6A3SWG2_9STRA|nr:hypothetical protein PF003_g1420 [Phytophthora fragariae]KAE8946788.1 hypothetical protein PF009_g3593 [Phytophthora fragariae]KAE9008693.1 hypothetical protein PF011_g10607 [Phytophthora fragariae]KAE9110133.1 hypothetical protein PF010_g11285 [Phytophthora fragariae]KAE9124826.1 hypothetical protein PF007_g6575 [Phytophthora fragariae]